MTASGAVRNERLNDSVNKLRKLMERFENRLQIEGLRPAEGYVNGRLKLCANSTLIGLGIGGIAIMPSLSGPIRLLV